MSFSFFLLFSRCAEMLDIAHDYHLLTLDCSSVCDGAASLTASLTGSRVSRVPLPMSPVTAAAPSPPASPRPVRPRPAAAGPPRPHHRTTGTACHCFSAGWRREETTAGIWWRALAGIHHLLQRASPPITQLAWLMGRLAHSLSLNFSLFPLTTHPTCCTAEQPAERACVLGKVGDGSYISNMEPPPPSPHNKPLRLL